MSRPRFSEMLHERRCELGLSVQQASRVLRLREDVLVAFEEGDYEHMPQSGYSQGMLSSYARYLGLDAREVVDLFQEELYEYKNGRISHELRRRTRDTQAGRGISGYDVVNEAGSRPKAYVEYRPLLPTSGGPAGDMGNFATTAPVRPRSSVPLAGIGAPAPGSRGAYSQGSALGEPAAYERAPQPERRPYNSTAPQGRPAPSTARRRAAGQRRRQDDPAARLLSEGQYAPGRAYRRDDVSTRRVAPSEYTDDLRYDDQASPFAPASTASGRRSSRNIASVERPNVRRREPQPGRGPRQAQPPRGRGPVAAVRRFFSDSRRASLFVMAVLLVLLTLIIVFSVKSCVGNASQPVEPPLPDAQSVEQNNSVPVSSADPATDDGSQASDAPAQPDEGASDAQGDAADDAAQAQQAGPVRLELSLAAGSSAWVEVTCDGSTVVSQTVAGPWSATYDVTQSATVQSTSPDALSVRADGTPVPFESKSGGVASLTVKAPAPAQGQSQPAGGAPASGQQAPTAH